MDITTYTLEDVIFVPIQSVSDDNGIQSVNVLKDDGSTEKREVETGIFNFIFIEIKSGLVEGDVIIVSPIE